MYPSSIPISGDNTEPILADAEVVLPLHCRHDLFGNKIPAPSRAENRAGKTFVLNVFN
jgi:hypothetical protein